MWFLDTQVSLAPIYVMFPKIWNVSKFQNFDRISKFRPDFKREESLFCGGWGGTVSPLPPRKRGTHPLGPPARWAESDFPRVSNTASPHHIWYSSNWNGLLYIIPALCQHTKLSHVHMSDCLVSEQRMNKQCYLWPSGDRFHSKRCRWENGRMVGFSWKTSPSDWTKRLLQGILRILIPATRFHNSITEWSAWN